MKFADLIVSSRIVKREDNLDEFLAGGVQQRAAAEMLEPLLKQSSMHHWKPGMPIPAVGQRYLIGVATWCAYDMALLDAIYESVTTSSADVRTPRIDVFDFASNCVSQEDLAPYIPVMPISGIFHTPVVGLWEDGVVVQYQSGSVARHWLQEALNLR